VILLAEHDEPTTLAAKKKRQPGASSWPTSTPKNRVWGFENTPSGRPVVEPQLTQENATGSVQYTYQIASGRAEWLSRDPEGEGVDATLYSYVGNNPVDLIDPMGLNPGSIFPSGGGGQFSWAGELGLGGMTGLTGSVGAGAFWNGQIENNGGYLSGGLTGYGKTAPCNGQSPFGVAAYLGIGGGFFFTNAGSVTDLSGPFSTYNLNTPVGSVQLGLSTNSAGQTTYIVNVSVGPGAGAGASGYPTNTVTTNATTLSRQP
jgi:hypothetical protein